MTHFSKTFPWEAKKVEYKYYFNSKHVLLCSCTSNANLGHFKNQTKNINNNIRKNQSFELACSLILISRQGYQKAFLL